MVIHYYEEYKYKGTWVKMIKSASIIMYNNVGSTVCDIIAMAFLMANIVTIESMKTSSSDKILYRCC